jgi:hypothetical protein
MLKHELQAHFLSVVATMNSYPEFIVGFSYVVKSPRQTKSGLSWLQELTFTQELPMTFSASPRPMKIRGYSPPLEGFSIEHFEVFSTR